MAVVSSAHEASVKRLIEVRSLRVNDRESWEVLSRGYKAFYNSDVSDEGYAACWRRLMENSGIFGVGALLDGQLVGIAHYLFHERVWANGLCYLQDLFVREEARGLGVARTLIEYLADLARRQGCSRLYWHTRENNDRARKLYESVATFDGFIRYDCELQI